MRLHDLKSKNVCCQLPHLLVISKFSLLFTVWCCWKHLPEPWSFPLRIQHFIFWYILCIILRRFCWKPITISCPRGLVHGSWFIIKCCSWLVVYEVAKPLRFLPWILDALTSFRLMRFPSITFSFGAGLLGSLAYIRMLGNSVDSMASSGSKKMIKYVLFFLFL